MTSSLKDWGRSISKWEINKKTKALFALFMFSVISKTLKQLFACIYSCFR